MEHILHESASIASTAIIGVRSRPLLTGHPIDDCGKVSIGPDVFVGEYALIGCGVSLGEGCIVDHGCIVETDATVGAGSLLCYRAQVGGESRVGANCVVGGFVGERSVIEDGARVFGSLVHRHPRSRWKNWDALDAMVDGPTIGRQAFIAFGAVIVGAIQIGENAYIGANAVVCKSIRAKGFVRPGSFIQ